MVHSLGASSRGNFRFGLHVSGRIQPILLLAIGFEIRITLALHTRSLVESTSRQKCVFSTRQGRDRQTLANKLSHYPSTARPVYPLSIAVCFCGELCPLCSSFRLVSMPDEDADDSNTLPEPFAPK